MRLNDVEPPNVYRPLHRRVKSIISHKDWLANVEELYEGDDEGGFLKDCMEFREEAKREGGPSANWQWLEEAMGGQMEKSFRIEFEELRA